MVCDEQTEVSSSASAISCKPPHCVIRHDCHQVGTNTNSRPEDTTSIITLPSVLFPSLVLWFDLFLQDSVNHDLRPVGWDSTALPSRPVVGEGATNSSE